MKKLIIAALALVSFSVASFSQVTPAAKKTSTAKVHEAKKATDPQSSKALALNKETKQPAAATSKSKEVKNSASAEKKQATGAAKKSDAGSKIKKHKHRTAKKHISGTSAGK